MISVSYVRDTYTARWGLTGAVVYKGKDVHAMADAIEAAMLERVP